MGHLEIDGNFFLEWKAMRGYEPGIDLTIMDLFFRHRKEGEVENIPLVSCESMVSQDTHFTSEEIVGSLKKGIAGKLRELADRI